MPDDVDDSTTELSDHISDVEEDGDIKMTDNAGDDTNGEPKKKYDPKDPSRPRRKKARRACFACQRAHLTCGDERPCQRCIKRGLADACQDGVRKKAKYLHDAPAEALRPVLGPNYNPSSGTATQTNGNRQNSTTSEAAISTPGSAFISAASTASYPVYSSTAQAGVTLSPNLAFNPQTTAASDPFPSPQPQIGGILGGGAMDFSALFDPSNPALYNFDLEGLNFGSQYAGWEFGILNKMGMGADPSTRDNSISQSTDPAYASLFANGNGATMLSGEYGGTDANASMYTQGNLQHGLPHAYAIAAAPQSLASPSTDATTSPPNNAEGSPKPNSFALQNAHAARIKTKPDKVAQILGKRQRDSAGIYTSVKEPYPYTKGFHNMVQVLRDRLPHSKVIKVARSLAEIRPSFIACTKDLTREDLVFMEKCFQRTLVEFHDFLQHCCAPTVVCRRSGEVAAVNKEFTALTGWTKDVLLGNEANRNVYGGGEGGEVLPPRNWRTGEAQQPVFLAELLDDDSVVDFYHDFGQLAFEDSRGKVQRSCRLMKYRTGGAAGVGVGDVKPLGVTNGGGAVKATAGSILSNRVTKIDGEHGISRIEKDGKVDCTYCWTIKRDVFDIPMMIIINFLPRYYPNQEPHQLAV
ncbi:C6 finger domain protein, putative [Cordyceps militaris CM01]|uniref:C6 finger domain protein, putative n=1 Tax=Cordyceps militaris (strain CM01) TaxID=983644 RepID=G3JUM6_CORMM|nr:C6 finger domain protein, putative [Cordyceps militaris CM01]EGX87762.1 C6 finger domain protein, putative [Cordyceps militaris CM01]